MIQVCAAAEAVHHGSDVAPFTGRLRQRSIGRMRRDAS